LGNLRCADLDPELGDSSKLAFRHLVKGCTAGRGRVVRIVPAIKEIHSHPLSRALSFERAPADSPFVQWVAKARTREAFARAKGTKRRLTARSRRRYGSRRRSGD
jgi:hypothetical protein